MGERVWEKGIEEGRDRPLGIEVVEEKREAERKGERKRNRETGREAERKEEKEVGQGPSFKREHSKGTQKVLLVAAAVDGACEDLKGRPVQVPEY